MFFCPKTSKASFALMFFCLKTQKAPYALMFFCLKTVVLLSQEKMRHVTPADGYPQFEVALRRACGYFPQGCNRCRTRALS